MERFVYMEKSRADRERPAGQRLASTVGDTVEVLASLPPRRYAVTEWLLTHRLLLSHPPPPSAPPTPGAPVHHSSPSTGPGGGGGGGHNEGQSASLSSRTSSPSASSSSSSSSSLLLSAGGGGKDRAALAMSGGAEGQVEEGLAMEELITLAGRFNSLVKGWRDGPGTVGAPGNGGTAAHRHHHALNPRRRRVLQQLNNHLLCRYSLLLPDPASSPPRQKLEALITDPAGLAFWTGATPYVRDSPHRPLDCPWQHFLSDVSGEPSADLAAPNPQHPSS